MSPADRSKPSAQPAGRDPAGACRSGRRELQRARFDWLGSKRPALHLIAATLLVFGATVAIAIDQLVFEVERIEGAGWRAQGIAVRLDLPQGTTGASATIARIELPAQAGELRNLRIDCPAVSVSAVSIGCGNARITANLSALGAQTLVGRVVFGRRDGSLELDLKGLKIGDGQVRIAARLEDSNWNAQLHLERVAVGPLVKLARAVKLPLPELSATGLVTLSVTATGARSSVHRARIDAKVSDLTANNAAGSLATDKLSFNLLADVSRIGGDWRFKADLQSHTGQAYAQPVFLDLGAHALALNAQGKLASDGTLSLTAFKLDHRDVALGQGSATIRFGDEQPLQALTLNLRALQFPGAYESYFQPLLLDTNFKSLKTSGRIAGDIVIEQGAPRRIELNFASVTVDDGSRNLVLNDLSGHWHWRDQRSSRELDIEEEDEATGASRSEDSMLRW